jgi:hypothetical protein
LRNIPEDRVSVSNYFSGKDCGKRGGNRLSTEVTLLHLFCILDFSGVTFVNSLLVILCDCY